MSDARTLLITGVSSGLGRAFARAAVTAGHRVVGTVRREEDARSFKDELGADAVLLDLNDAERVPAVVAQAEAGLGGVDVLVNNAGFGHEGAVEESPLEALRRQLDVNVVGQVALIQAVLPGMRARGRGHIVNVTSMAGTVGLPGIGFYCAAKFALEGLSEALSKEVRPLGVHVTAFAPGQFRTRWAGQSLERSGRTVAAYDAVIDPLRANRLMRDGRQPGDPDKAAALLMALIASPNPPAHVLVGADALTLANQKLKRLSSEIAVWDVAGRAMDYDD